MAETVMVGDWVFVMQKGYGVGAIVSAEPGVANVVFGCMGEPPESGYPSRTKQVRVPSEAVWRLDRPPARFPLRRRP